MSNQLRQAHLHRLRETTHINDVNTAEICQTLFHEGYEPEHPAVKLNGCAAGEKLQASKTITAQIMLTATLMQILRQEQTGRASLSEAPRMLPVSRPAQTAQITP